MVLCSACVSGLHRDFGPNLLLIRPRMSAFRWCDVLGMWISGGQTAISSLEYKLAKQLNSGRFAQDSDSITLALQFEEQF
jgi:hypothetical protein